MGIENDIKQRHFRNDQEKAIINLLFTHNWVRDQIQGHLASYGLTMQQFNILRILRGASSTPLSTLQIRERMLDKMSDVSRLVDRLIIKKLAKKNTCKEDRRLVDVVITQAGLTLLEKLDSFSAKMDNLLSSLTTEETKKLNYLLDKIRFNPVSTDQNI